MVPTGWLERMREDHRKVLERLAQIAPETPHGPGRPPLTAVREFVDFLAGQFETHMAAEDAALFPIVLRTLPAVTDTLAPLQLEHRELRTMLQALRELLDAPAGEGRDEQIGVQLADFAELLRIHMQKEERLVFQVAERVLRPGELERLVSERVAGLPASRSTTDSTNEGNSR